MVLKIRRTKKRQHKLEPSSKQTMGEQEEDNNNGSSDGSKKNATGSADDDNANEAAYYHNEEGNIVYNCDESKCVSSMIYNTNDDDDDDDNAKNIFTCYAEDSDVSPLACTDGYKGYIVENEPPLLRDEKNLFYYTCCLPSNEDGNNNHPSTNSNSSSNNNDSSATRPSNERHCSNPITLEEKNSSNKPLCEGNGNSSRTRPRNITKVIGHIDSYLCCDLSLPSSANSISSSINKSKNFLDDEMDCVPYFCGDVHYNCISNNHYGHLEVMKCQQQQSNNSDAIFRFPRIVATHGNDVRFECCRTGSDTEILAMNTTAFQLTFWLEFVVAFITLMMSSVLMIALLIPILSKYWSCRCRRSSPTPSTPSSLNRQGNNRTGITTTQQQGDNTYNLYLVFLALPDVVVNTFMVLICIISLTGHTFDAQLLEMDWVVRHNEPQKIMGFVIFGCNTANIGMNAIIAYAVFTLLRNSHQRIRSGPPSLRRVLLQATGVYVYAIIITTVAAMLLISVTSMRVVLPVVFFITAGVPFLLLVYFYSMVWKRGYLKGSDHRRLKVLAIYFLRIGVVFTLIWIPGYILWYFSFLPNIKHPDTGTTLINGPIYAVAILFFSLQAIVSTSLALMKPDVRRAVLNLLTLSVFRNNNNNNSNNSNSSSQEAITNLR